MGIGQKQVKQLFYGGNSDQCDNPDEESEAGLKNGH
jgi:hypothetical protein